MIEVGPYLLGKWGEVVTEEEKTFEAFRTGGERFNQFSIIFHMNLVIFPSVAVLAK